MKRVVKIDGITLDYPLHISSEFDIDDYIGSKTVAVDGSTIMFVQPRGALTKDVSIYSKDSGWVGESVKASLIASVGMTPIEVEFNDASTETYYYDHTKTPISFTPLYEGAEWYSVEINLLKG